MKRRHLALVLILAALLILAGYWFGPRAEERRQRQHMIEWCLQHSDMYRENAETMCEAQVDAAIRYGKSQR